MTLLNQVLLPQLLGRYQNQGKRSLILTIGSSFTLLPSPLVSVLYACKVYSDRYSKALYYEMRNKGIDVVICNSAGTSTNLTGNYALKGLYISPVSVAKGALNNTTVKNTYGALLHEIQLLFVENFILSKLF